MLFVQTSAQGVKLFEAHRAILASWNDEIDDINDQILKEQPVVAKIYYSADTKVVISDEGISDDFLYTTVFLNSVLAYQTIT